MLAMAISFFNIPMLIFVAILIAIAVVIALAPPPLGPAKLLQIAVDSRTWMIIVGVAIAITFYHNAQVVQQQAVQINTDQQNSTAGKDSAAVVTDVVGKKQKQNVQAEKQMQVITTAPDGSKEDDLLDEIAKENNDAP